MIRVRQVATVFAVLVVAAACKASQEAAKVDSARVAELKLTNQLAAEKDSLTSVVLEADKFITTIDSQLSRVKGLPTGKAKKDSSEGPIQEQLEARRRMLVRVDALVLRAQSTARQLAESRRNVTKLAGENKTLRDTLDHNVALISELGSTIQRQTARIDELSIRVDSLTASNAKLGGELATLTTAHNQVYYIIGREEDLLKKGIVVREGGANLLLAHPGRTLQPARAVDQQLFTPIDQRQVHEIAMPDTAQRYQIVSRQSLDDADVAAREKTSFKGNLKIKDAERFWAPSRFLIIVQK
jgi:hypothetical protein